MVAHHFAFRECVPPCGTVPTPAREPFILTDLEQTELLIFLWSQWINPNKFPHLKMMLDRLEKVKTNG